MLHLFADHDFHSGAAHLSGGKPCQDYALSGARDGLAYGIVADGCSSGGHTDMGARLAAFSAARALEEHRTLTRRPPDARTPMAVAVRQRFVLNGMRQVLGLDQQDMLATCAYAALSPDGGVAHLCGDGAMAWRLRNGLTVVSRFDWAGNTPFYPAYAEDGLGAFVRAHGGDREARVFSEERWVHAPGQGFARSGSFESTVAQGIEGVTRTFSAWQVRRCLAFLAVFTDGVTQIDGVDWKDAVLRLLSFKNTKGAFAKRRMIRTLREDRQDGRGPIDDIAYAVVRVDADPPGVA